jgi:hypothetical protein
MGFWNGLCIFDYATFTQLVIPSLQAGEESSIVRQTIKKLNNNPFANLEFKGLAQVVSTCEADMTTCALGKNFHVNDGKLMLKPIPEVIEGDYWSYENFVELFESVIARHAITHFYIFGKSPGRLNYLFPKDVFGSCSARLLFESDRIIFPEELGIDRVLHQLIARLDKDENYWSHGNGITGWLNPEETELFLITLEDLPACQQAPYPPDSDFFQRLYRSQPLQVPERHDYETHWKNIERVRSMTRMAAQLGHGLLWGRDLRLFYHDDDDRLFDDHEVKPLDLR